MACSICGMTTSSELMCILILHLNILTRQLSGYVHVIMATCLHFSIIHRSSQNGSFAMSRLSHICFGNATLPDSYATYVSVLWPQISCRHALGGCRPELPDNTSMNTNTPPHTHTLSPFPEPCACVHQCVRMEVIESPSIPTH